MKYFNKVFKHICLFKREMSSFKISLWENVMFINSVVSPGETESKLIVNMLVTLKKKKKINLCRSPSDTIKTFIDRLSIKLSQAHSKKKEDKPKINDILIQVNEVTVSDDALCGEVFKENTSNITIQFMNNIFKVLVNIPIANEFKLGSPSYKGLMLYPYKFDKGYNVSILKSQYVWYRIDSKNIVEVGNQMTYVPTANDVNCCLKLVCKPCNENGVFGPIAEIVSSKVLDNTIEIYPFENRLKQKPYDSIRVVSYNILAREYTKTKEAKSTMYPYCSTEVLDSSYRNPLLFKELEEYKADIICLQEVESNFFTRELSPLLKQLMGLDGTFFKKDGSRNEGLSCFYSPDKFIFLKTFNIKLSDLITLEMFCGPVIKDIIDDELWKQGVEKKTILQVIALQLISDSKQILLVCNTHLISNPDGDSIRLFQALIELTIINKIKKNFSNDYPHYNVSVVFCGDFNSTPESGVFDLVTKLTFPQEYDKVEILNNLKNVLDFKYNSAYDINVKYSNYTQEFSGLLDYIYYTDQNFELIQVLSMPSHDDVIKYGGLPSLLFPSDHLALVADLKVK